jgi:hypothetical protein
MDEELFFSALRQVLPPGAVLHNADDQAAAAAIRQAGAACANHHWDQDLPEGVAAAMDLVLERLQGRRDGYKEAGLASYLDGMVRAGEFGPCLVEFDEEQHFSPFRLATIEILSPEVQGQRFDLDLYRRYCTDPVCFRRFWDKHRLPPDLLRPGQTPPRSVLEFTGTILRRLPPNPATRYYASVPGFPFVGGRIAQRAYYDALRDCYHLTREGRMLGLRPVIRIAKYQVESALGKSMGAAGASELQDAVASLLRDVPGNGDSPGDRKSGLL